MDETREFVIYPAIDIFQGECVRLEQGEYSKSTTYNTDPVFVARQWESRGAKFIHIVDLDGAKEGNPKNLQQIKNIVDAVNIPTQLGGGIRNLATAKQIIDLGVSRVIIGSAIIKDEDFAKQALNELGDKVVVGMDCREGKLAISGWTETSSVSAIEKAIELKSYGLKNVIYTDISRDGMLTGPNLTEMKDFMTQTGINLIASGGVSDLADIETLKALQHENYPIEGVIVGKALYTNNIKPEELFKI